jgi:hypothetical protein
MMNSFRFGTAINCIDGRTQQVVIDHMKQNYNIDGVDMVTFPGADGLFSNGDHSEEIALIRRAVSISIGKHDSRIIAVVGHYDCAGNAVTRNITICIYGWVQPCLIFTFIRKDLNREFSGASGI